MGVVVTAWPDALVLYFEKNQLFDIKKDSLETKNVFDKNKTEANEMKKLLVKILKSFPQRPYGEFTK